MLGQEFLKEMSRVLSVCWPTLAIGLPLPAIRCPC